MGYQVYASLTIGVCGEDEHDVVYELARRHLSDYVHPPAPIDGIRKGYRCVVCSFGRSFGDAGDEAIGALIAELAKLRASSDDYVNLAWALVSFWGDQDGARVERGSVRVSPEREL